MNDTAHPAITMYSTGWCPYCDRARGLLELALAADRSYMLALPDGGADVPRITLSTMNFGVSMLTWRKKSSV